ncbi:MAG: AmmeMemoRadiSam system radical SAM enzyme, partial [Candidatus Omnitrophota bacterium]
SLIYNRISSMHADPIEKKPLFHFYPGSICFSLGTLGCNFHCPGCQNWEISHAQIDEYPPAAIASAGSRRTRSVQTGNGRGVEELPPQESVGLALKNKCRGISWTYNEPTVWFEYTLEGAKLAKQNNLYTVYVTNGYITPEALEAISPHLDAFRVDIKGFSDKAYEKITGVKALNGVLDSTKLAMHKYKMHVECITNITPAINDDEQELKSLASWIKNELSADTPWHVTRFYPYSQFSHLSPTPIAKLEKIRQIGLDAGLRYIYLGNVSGHNAENTYCYNCNELLIERDSFLLRKFKIKNSRCPKCNTSIFGSFSTTG